MIVPTTGCGRDGERGEATRAVFTSSGAHPSNVEVGTGCERPAHIPIIHSASDCLFSTYEGPI